MATDTLKPPAANRPKTTAATAVFLAIREDILAGRLAPGLRLKIEQLCERYETTANPVREALNRLSSEGFVDIEDQRGFSVAPISLERWRELVRSRRILEGCVLREAMSNRTEAWEDGIVVSLYRLRRTPRFLSGSDHVPNPEWELRHHGFHNALLESCNSAILLNFCEELREQSDRYRHIASISPNARQTYDDEHQAIADAVLEGRTERAVDLLGAHYNMTLSVVENYFRDGA